MNKDILENCSSKRMVHVRVDLDHRKSQISKISPSFDAMKDNILCRSLSQHERMRERSTLGDFLQMKYVESDSLFNLQRVASLKSKQFNLQNFTLEELEASNCHLKNCSSLMELGGTCFDITGITDDALSGDENHTLEDISLSAELSSNQNNLHHNSGTHGVNFCDRNSSQRHSSVGGSFKHPLMQTPSFSVHQIKRVSKTNTNSGECVGKEEKSSDSNNRLEFLKSWGRSVARRLSEIGGIRIFPDKSQQSLLADQATMLQKSSVFSLPAVSPSLWQIDAPMYVIDGEMNICPGGLYAGDLSNILNGKSSVLALHAIPPPRMPGGKSYCKDTKKKKNFHSVGHIMFPPSTSRLTEFPGTNKQVSTQEEASSYLCTNSDNKMNKSQLTFQLSDNDIMDKSIFES